MPLKFNWRLKDRELSPEQRREVLEDLFVFGRTNQGPFLVRMAILLILSTIIATAGLLSDSAAVVIGAMLVAPLMTPVLSAAAAVVMGWAGRFYGAMWLLLAMAIGALTISAFITLLSPELVFLPEQVLARTRPTFYDLLIALAAGSAGAYTITRKESSAIPGVAVAVALLPPLASAGILLMTGEYELALRAVILFFTNLVAMVLAGALTFIAVGVSPASARRHSAAFIKNKLWLFFILMMAISVPLYFYSEKILFNSDYKAAKSIPLQNWLRENNLTLTDVEILVEKRTLFLELEGPNPPINIQSLYESLSNGSTLTDYEVPLHIKYTWTQRVDGSWPTTSTKIEDTLAGDLSNAKLLLAHEWVWDFTQYDAERGSRPSKNNSYILHFDDQGKISVTANCGVLKGTYSIRGKSIDMKIRKFNWLKCRDEPSFELFQGDLLRSDAFYIQDEKLQLTLATESGIMNFRKR